MVYFKKLQVYRYEIVVNISSTVAPLDSKTRENICSLSISIQMFLVRRIFRSVSSCWNWEKTAVGDVVDFL